MLYDTLCKQLQVYTELSELIPWLQLLVNQLPQQRLVAVTKEQLQVQSDWLKVKATCTYNSYNMGTSD